MNFFEELFERRPELAPCKSQILKAYEILRDSFAAGGKLIVAGNGGSAADSNHIVGELLKGFEKKRPIDPKIFGEVEKIDTEAAKFLSKNLQGSLPAVSLCANDAVMTAIANDTSADLIFAQQAFGFVQKNDVFLGISTSGNSKNVFYAALAARAKGAKTIALTGKDGGKLKTVCDAAIVAPESKTRKIQELHLPIYHALCLQLEEEFFK